VIVALAGWTVVTRSRIAAERGTGANSRGIRAEFVADEWRMSG